MSPSLDEIYFVLRGWARSGLPATYTELSAAYKARTGTWFEPHQSWEEPLGELNRRLHAVGAPALSALVVLAATYPFDGSRLANAAVGAALPSSGVRQDC
jgi:hypothetical protein